MPGRRPRGTAWGLQRHKTQAEAREATAAGAAFLLLHLALPGRAPGLTYRRQGHMSCQPCKRLGGEER